jgi:hypothetical protein
MKLQRMFCCITGAFIAVGFAASQAGAGTDPPVCDFEIEINALRGGSPTTPFGSGATKDITSKARIAKGSAVSGTTIVTQLKIEAFNGGQYVDQSRQVSLVTLGVGKGGQGDKLRINLSLTDCSSESIDFVATFTGPDDDGDECTASKTINKICKAPR